MVVGIQDLGGGDERLGRHHVGEDSGTTDAALLDQECLGAVPGGGEGGLIAAGAAADDHHPGPPTGVREASGVGRQGCAGIAHPAIVAKSRPVRGWFGGN